MPAGFRRHLVGKTLINVFHCYSAEIRFVGKLTSLNADIFINQRIECYLNNTTNLRPLTTHIMPCYTHKMTIISVTSFHPIYTPTHCRQACTAIRLVGNESVMLLVALHHYAADAVVSASSQPPRYTNRTTNHSVVLPTAERQLQNKLMGRRQRFSVTSLCTKI